MSWTRRLAVATGLAVAAVGIAVPLSLSSTPASATESVAPLAAVSQLDGAARQGKLPKQLRQDLKAAWAAPDGQRVAALQAVLAKAVAGDYGDRVQRRAQRLSKALANLDASLKSDLQKAIELPKDERHAALKDIRQKIRDGAYGDDAKRQAKILRRLHRLRG